MSSLSVFAGVCLFFSSALVGLWIKKRYLRKATVYEEYYRFLNYASEKINYERMPIAEIKKTFQSKGKGDFSEFLFGEGSIAALSEKESSEIVDFLSKIGTSDADTEIASLKAKCAELKRFSEEDCVKMKKDGALYFKLFVLLGIVAFILIV